MLRPRQKKECGPSVRAALGRTPGEGKPPHPPKLLKRKSGDQISWGNSGKDRLTLTQFRRLLDQISDGDQRLLMFVANKMALRKTKR